MTDRSSLQVGVWAWMPADYTTVGYVTLLNQFMATTKAAKFNLPATDEHF